MNNSIIKDTSEKYNYMVYFSVSLRISNYESDL